LYLRIGAGQGQLQLVYISEGGSRLDVLSRRELLRVASDVEGILWLIHPNPVNAHHRWVNEGIELDFGEIV
jgi:hypothetical protein